MDYNFKDVNRHNWYKNVHTGFYLPTIGNKYYSKTMDGSHLKMTFTWRCQKPCEDLRKTIFCWHRLIAIDSSKQKALDADSRKFYCLSWKTANRILSFSQSTVKNFMYLLCNDTSTLHIFNSSTW